jgi:hypothetical protein
MLDEQGYTHASACTRPRARYTHARTHINMWYLLLFHDSSSYVNAPQCYVIVHFLSCLLVRSDSKWNGSSIWRKKVAVVELAFCVPECKGLLRPVAGKLYLYLCVSECGQSEATVTAGRSLKLNEFEWTCPVLFSIVFTSSLSRRETIALKWCVTTRLRIACNSLFTVVERFDATWSKKLTRQAIYV